MAKRIFLFILISGVSFNVFAQKIIEITFTAIYDTTYTRLDSIKIMNRSKGVEMILKWPDSLLVLDDQIYKTSVTGDHDKENFFVTPDDLLLYIGYMNNLQSGILDVPETSDTITFQFATNIPCPGTPTIVYEGQDYNTIQIFSQCWMKENLNVGTMITGIKDMVQNGVIEKYCFDDNEMNCDKYGGLYQWDEMMSYSKTAGTKGICPPGFHIPTNEEWKVLEGAVDSQFRIGDPEWDNKSKYRGFDVGNNLKSNNGWFQEGNGSDKYGFTALPTGYRVSSKRFGHFETTASWWTSTEGNTISSWRHRLYWEQSGEYSNSHNKPNGYSVRCLRD
jgi:uncharacterized protein (TIGR02145 family)